MSIKPPPAKKAKALDLNPVAAPKPLTKKPSGEISPLSFKVTPEFHRQFKAYAAGRGEKMIDVLLRAVGREMEEQG